MKENFQKALKNNNKKIKNKKTCDRKKQKNLGKTGLEDKDKCRKEKYREQEKIFEKFTSIIDVFE